ncbi:divergent polysaccharide deacetylase family protein [candidate division KSB1 bacterium]|nr:divergent polysaccharide deacetylase family protein [candidate division KSB1 bacterium]
MRFLKERTKQLLKRLLPIPRKARGQHDEFFPEWQKALLIVFALNLVLLVGLDSHYLSQLEAPAKRDAPKLPLKTLTADEQLRFALDRTLSDFGVALAWMEDRENTRLVRIPSPMNAARLRQKLIDCLEQNDARVIPSARNPLEFSYARNEQTLGTIRLLPEARTVKAQGKIAIVIDDFGYHENGLITKFINLPFAITYAIIPGLPYSQQTARKLERKNKTMLVHMPMEAMEKAVETNGFELRVGMSAEEIRERVRKARTLLPYAVGMNNHMGSRATQDDALMQVLCEELKSVNWLFLDSRTIETTKAFTTAKAHGLDAALNDTFLDSVEELEAARKKVWRLAEIAEQRGSAIGIGHPYPITLQALQEIVPVLQQRGFEFITLEQLLRPKQVAPLPTQPSLARRNG